MNKLLIGALSAFFCASTFAADVPQDNSLDTLILAFKQQAQTWEPVIYTLTLGLFTSLVLISFTWTFMQMALKAETGLVDVVAELTRRTLLIGVNLYLIQSAPDLGRVVIQSFVEVGARISSGAVTFSPSNVFELGLNIVAIAWDATSFTDPVASLLMVLVALIVMACFAMMAMDMAILIVSGYIIVSGGIIAMGFLGSDWTKEHALNYFTAVLGIAFKMFVMQLIFITGYSFIEAWGSAISAHSANTDYLAMVGISLIFAGLLREIPQLAASLASGRFTLSGGGIQAAAMGAMAGAAGATLLTSAGIAATHRATSSFSTNEASSPNSSDDATGAHSLDTGQGDTSRTFSSADTAASGNTPTASPAKMASAGLKAAGKVAEASLHSLATRSAFGSLLAAGAKQLGEAPVDFEQSTKEDILRQLNAASSSPSSEFDDRIEAAPSPTPSSSVETPSHVEEEK